MQLRAGVEGALALGCGFIGVADFGVASQNEFGVCSRH
jgi:hypothetical protein